MRLKALQDFLAQAGKRLSKETLDAMREIMDKMEALVGDDDETTEQAVEQFAVASQKPLLQAMATGISVADTYDMIMLRVARALTRDKTLPGSSWSRWAIYTHPDWVAFSVWDSDSESYQTYIVDYVDDGSAITFSNVRSASIETIIRVIDDTTYEFEQKQAMERLLEQGQSIEPEVYMQEGPDGPMFLQMVKGSVHYQKRSDGRYVIQGIATHGNVANRYDTPVVFPTACWASELSAMQSLIEQGKAIGCLGHPATEDGQYREATPQDYCIRFTKLEQNGDLFPFEAISTTNQTGKDFAALMDDGVMFDMSTVSFGKVKKQDWDGQEMMVVQPEGFKWVRIADVVLEGASPGAEITDVRLQALNSEPNGQEDAMNPEEIKQLIEDLRQSMSADNKAQIEALQAQLQKMSDSLEQTQTQPALTEEQTTLLKQAAEIVAERDAAKVAQERDNKVTEVIDAMVQAGELPKELIEPAKTMYQGMASKADEVEGKKAKFLEVMAPMLAQHKHLQSIGFYAPEYNEDGTKKGKIESLDQGVNELLDSLEVRGMMQKYDRQSLPFEGPDGEKLRDFSNKRQNLYRMCQTLINAHPEIGAAYLQLRNGELKTLQQSVDLMGKVGAKHLMQAAAGTMTTDIAAALPYVLPMMLEIWPQLVVDLFATTQPLEKSTGRIYYLKHRYDDDDAYMSAGANFTGSYANDPGENEQVKYINMEITSEDVSTDGKKLGWKASAQVLRNLMADFGVDGRSDMVRMCAAFIALEWNYNHICNIIDGATGGTQTYGKAIPADSSFDGEQWQKQIHRFCQNVRSQIWRKTFAESFYWFGDSDSIDRLIDAQERGQYTANGRGQIARGVDIVGTLATGETLVKVGWLEDIRGGNKMICCARGKNWPETGYVIAPYLGLFVTPEFINPDTQQSKQSMLSEVADKMVDGNYFGTLTITTDAGTPL